MHALSARSVITLIITALVATAVPLTVLTAPANAEPSAGPDFAPVPTTIPDAATALIAAKATLKGQVTNPDPTLALRDLAARLPEYRGRDRVVAERLLARPNGGKQGLENSIGAAWPRQEAPNSPLCDAEVCVHWTRLSRHAPPLADKDSSGFPDRVEITLDEMANVWDTEINDFGYRPPLTDQRASIDAGGGFDVYLSDIGNLGYYGYCSTDDSRTFKTYKFYDRAAYCVLDDDFARKQFPSNTPVQNLRVTAAHEFFHAIQFGYDFLEDAWFMEGTAAWIEDEVYDRVNDNRQYLRTSQFVSPEKPLDTRRGQSIYGSWGYFRYLSEKPTFTPAVVRTAWERADAAKGGPDDYSLPAIKRAIKRAGGDSADIFGDFAAAILTPAKSFDEGSAYPSPRVRVKRLGGPDSRTGWLRSRIDHLAMAYRSVAPSDRAGRRANLRIRIDAPRRAAMPQARVVVTYVGGAVDTRTVALSRRGNGAVTVDFGRNQVKRVTAALVNASDRFRKCYSGRTSFSCNGGVPADDNRTFWVAFRVS